MGREGPLVLISRGRRPLWSYWWRLGFFLGSQWVNFLGPCHAGNKMTLTEGTPPLKLSTHAILLLLSSRVQEGASRCPIQHTWVEEDSGELNRPFHFSGATSAVYPHPRPPPPSATIAPPLGDIRTQVFPSPPLPLSPCFFPQRNSSKKEEALAFPFSLERAPSKSHPCSWDTKPHSSAEMTESVSSLHYRKNTNMPDLCLRPSS